jgi:signal transduction histidine kinase
MEHPSGSASLAPRGQEAVLRAIVENLPAGYCLVDERTDAVLRLNRTFGEVWGLAGLESLAVRGSLRYGELLERMRPLVADAEGFDRAHASQDRAGAARMFEDEFVLRDGRTLRRQSTPLASALGEYVGRLELYEDVTRRVQAELERRTIERRMEDVRKLESLGVLAGGIAHDFNNLLTSIVGNAELAATGAAEGSALRRQMERIIDAGGRAAELCRRMLSYAGADSASVKRIHLSDLVHGALHWMKPQITTRIHVHEELAADLPGVLGDPIQLNQVVVNLVANACEAIGDRGGQLRVATGAAQRDELYFARTSYSHDLPPGEYVFVEVRDDGCGIDPAMLGHIFDPFFSTKFAGRGLGLSAVLGIVRSHRGAISVESAVDTGTTMRVDLPAAPPVTS